MTSNQWYTGFFMLLLFSIYACRSTIQLPGDYSSNNVSYSFILNADSTFIYRYKYQFAYEYSQGTWFEFSRKRVVLNSRVKDRAVPLQVYGLDNDGIDSVNYFSISVNLSDNDLKYYQCLIFINDTLYGKRSCDSLSSITIASPVRDIYFKISADIRKPTRSLDTLCTVKYFTKSFNANKKQVDIIINDSLFNYRVFDNDILKVTEKGLKFYDSIRAHLISIPKKR